MISGTVILFTLLFEKHDEFLVKTVLSCACAVESIITINMIAKIYGAW